MTTIKEYLGRNGFDFDNGRIIIQTNHPVVSWDSKSNKGYVASFDDPILNQDFDDGFGIEECHGFIAEDDQAIYLPEHYDGSTSCFKILKKFDEYVGNNPISTPYPGGG